jgi:hypothetical protein
MNMRRSLSQLLAGATLIGALAATGGCGKGDANGKLLSSDKIKAGESEFLLARAHDFDRACETLYLNVPVRTQLGDATEDVKGAFAAAEDVDASPTKIRRWDYVLMHNQQNPQSYEAIFIGEWHPVHGRKAANGPNYALFTPLRCVVTKSAVQLFELEPPFVEDAGAGPSKRSAAIVAKYSRIAPGVGESVEQRTQEFATSDKANVKEAAALSVIVKEQEEHAAPTASGSSSPR